MADENTQTTQNTGTQDQTAQPVAPVVEATPAPVATPAVEPAPPAPEPAIEQAAAPTPEPEEPATPVQPEAAQPEPAPAAPEQPEAAPEPAAPAVEAAPVTPTPAPAQPEATPVAAPAATGGGVMAGLGLGSLKNAVNSAKDVATQGQSGLGKMTGTLSSAAGNVKGAVTGECNCPEVNVAEWDKKKVVLKKTFYKTFSPRIFGYHFSDAIDKNRGMIDIKVKDYKAVEKPMILDTNSLLWATLFIEVEGANAQDSKVVTLDKEFYCKVTKNTSRKDLKLDLVALEQEMGKKPTEIYFWFISCPKCGDKKEMNTIILAA